MNYPKVLIDDGNDLIFPSIIEASLYFKNPLGKYYLYTSPHSGAAIFLYYSDSLSGPWSKKGIVIDKRTGRNRHVSSPHAIYNHDLKKLMVFVHAPNSQTIVCLSEDGINFKYEKIVVKASELMTATGYPCKAASYARVYKHTIPEYGNTYAMTLSAPEVGNRRIQPRKTIVLCTSDDALKWTPRKILVDDGNQGHDFQTLDGFFFQRDNKNYIAYALRSRKKPGRNVSIHYAMLDENWKVKNYLGELYKPQLFYPDYTNSRGAFLIPDKELLIYEAGSKYKARICSVKL